jgi:hypothetical protein
MAVIIADEAAQTLAVGQNHRNLTVGINQRFQVSGLGSGVLRVNQIVDVLMRPRTIGPPLVEMVPPGKSHKIPVTGWCSTKVVSAQLLI